MSKVVTIGGATLYLGDCHEILPGLQADHVISDPPYEDELHAAIGRIRRNDGREMIADLGFEGINATRHDIAHLCVEASRGWCLLFTLAEGVREWRDALQAAGAKYDTCCAWVKPDSAPRFNGQGPARGFECFVTAWCAPGYRSWNAGGKRGIYQHCVNGPGRHGEHPTEKPISLMTEIIADFTKPDDIILDPFKGSGTTGIAALKMGRRFIGVEKSPEYFELACSRIRASLSGASGFKRKQSDERQPDLLGGLL